MPNVLYFHPKTRRPGCVLLQAVYGGDTAFLNRHVPSEYWLIEGIGDGLVPMTIRDGEIERFKDTLKTLHEAGWPEL